VANRCETSNGCTHRLGNTGIVAVLLGNGDGTFQKAMPYNSGGYYAISDTVADVNGDGKLDLVVVNYCGNDSSCQVISSTVGVLINISKPMVMLSPAHLDFGNQTVGITSHPRISTLTNVGTRILTITSIAITGTNSGDFAQTNDCPKSVPPKSTCKIKVTFTPSDTGARSADVNISDNASNSPQLLPLKGVGVLPSVKFFPTQLTFPDQTIFTTSNARPVKVTNTGLGILLVSKITTTGEFRLTNDCPSHLRHGASCIINVRFHPKTKGVQRGSLNLTDNASGSPQKVPLTGTGTFVELAPAKLDFGTQPVGTRSLPKKITMTNKGDSAINITGIAITGTDAGDFAETNTCGKSLASGASCFIKVTFKPLAKGKRTADVSIYDNGGGSPQAAKLTGTGT
jgi:hypothetical protein